MDCGDKRYFVKENDASMIDMFHAEYIGLKKLRELVGDDDIQIIVPMPLFVEEMGEKAYFAMEYLDMTSRSSTEDGYQVGF